MSGQRYSVTIDIGANISSVKSAAQQLKTIFDDVGLGAGQSSRVSNMFKDLDKALADVQKKSSTALTSIGEARSLDKAKDRVTTIISNINEEFAKMGKLGNTELTKNFSELSGKINEATKAIRTYNTSLTEINKGHNAAKTSSIQVNRALEEQTRYFEQLENIRKKFQGKTDAEIDAALKQRQSNAKGLETRRQNELENFVKQHGGRINTDKTVDKGWRKSFESKASQQDKDTLDKLVTAAQNASTAFKTAQENYTNFSNALQNFKGQENFDKLTKDAREAADALKKFEGSALNDAAFNKLKSTLEQIFGSEVTAGIQNSSNAVNEFQERINQVSADKLEEFRKKVPEINNLLNQMGVTGQDMGKKIKTGMDSLGYAKEAASEMDLLSSRLKYFFSLAGGFNLMRRAIRSAVTTTKELDAVMTQTAVVSNYTVKDMWKTLPQYSKEAKKLGVAIKDVYSAQTLYVQQGLDMNSAMDIGVETMKMARVANIGAEEATNSMTAALRGFNMELNETSAKRINDVYSKLAQNTASNTQEISTAMTKTAALANSANMSFENTAAFLATIIESTREGAETAGTALKTVIARFTEVKQLYKKGELTGTDEEGQVVDVNKISKALRTAGINMNDFFTGAKGLDEIFKELGSKWSSLTTVQQRYIATMAAGSRQQSRFLALMQNYDRTIQLTEMAYNSAGSGEEQFSKTLDSLEAKLNQFKAAWDTFIMGIANSDLIKGFIDFGTQILNIINKMTTFLSGGNGLVKSVESLALAFGTFKGLGAIFKGMMGGFLTSFTGRAGGGAQPGFFLDRWGKALKQRGTNLVTAFKKNEITSRRALNPFENIGIRKKKVFGEQGKQSIIDLKKEVAARKETYEASQRELQKLQDQDAERWAESVGRGKDTGYYNNSSFDREQREKDYQRAVGKQQEKVDKNQQKLKESETNLATANQGVTDTLMAQASAMQSVGIAAGILAGIFGALSSALESEGNYKISAWFNGAAKGLGVLAASLTVCGTAFMAFGQAAAAGSAAAQAALSAIPIIGWAAAIVSIIVGLVSAFNNLDQISEKKKENISEALQSNQTELKDLKNSYDEINDSLEKIDQKQTTFENLTKGTTAWKEAAEELNTEIEKILEEFPKLMEAITFDEKGNMIIDVEKAKELNKERETQIKNREIANVGFQNELVDNTVGTKKQQQKFENAWKYVQNNYKETANKLNQAVEEGKLTNLPINNLLAWYNKTGSYDQTWWQMQNSNAYESLITYLTKATGLTQSDLNYGIFSSSNYDQGLGALLHLYNTKIASSYDEKDIKNNTLLLRSKKIADSFKDFDTGALKNFLTEQTEQIFLKAFDEWNGTDVDTEYIERYHAARGDKGSAEKGKGFRNANGEEVKTATVEEAKAWARTNDAFLEIDNYLDKVLGAINQVDDKNFQEALKGRGKYRYYNGDEGDFRTKLGSILSLSDELSEVEKTGIVDNLVTDFLQPFDNFKQLAKDVGYQGDLLKNLDYTTTSQVTSIVSKIGLNKGKTSAKNALSNLQYLFSSYSGLSNEEALDVLLQIDSGKINNSDDLDTYLKRKPGYKSTISGTSSRTEEIAKLFKYFQKNRSYKDWTENFSDEWEFYNSIKSSNGVFSQEDIAKLLSIRNENVTEEVFKEGGHYTGNVDDLAEYYRKYLVDEITKTSEALKIGEKSAQQFAEGIKNKPTGIDSKIWDKFLAGELEGLKEKNLREIANSIWGPETKLYNAQTGDTIALSEIINEDLSYYLDQYLNDTFKDLSIEAQELDKKKELITNNFNQLTQEIQNSITDMVHEASKTHTKTFAGDLLTQLVTAGVNIKKEGSIFGTEANYQKFLSADLEGLDWSSINNIEKFQKALFNLGISFNTGADGAKKLYETLVALYKTSKPITAEQVAETAQFGSQLKTKIKSTGNGNYSQEEVNYILAQNDNQNLINDFVRDIESGGYTYVGDVEKLQKAAEVALKENGFRELEAQYELSKTTGELTETQNEWLNTLFGKTAKELTEEEIAQIDALRAQQSKIAYDYNLVKDMEPYVNMTNDQARMAGASPEIQQAIALQDAQRAGLNTNEVAKYAQQLQEVTEAQQETERLSDEMAYAIAYDNMLMNQGISELASNFATWQQYLDNPSLPDYTTAVDGLRESLQKITGTTYNFSDAFLTSKKTLELFKKAADGDTKALADLKKASAKEIVQIDKLADKNLANEINNAIDGLDLENIEVGVELDQNVADVFQNLYQQGLMSAEGIQQAYEAMNFEGPEIGTVRVPVTMEESIDGSGTTVWHDFMGNEYTEDNVTHNAATEEAYVEIPVIGGSSLAKSSGSNLQGGTSKGGTKKTTPSKKGGGGGGGGKKEFKNDFDKYYNQVQDINELERQRNLLEKDYEQLLKAENLTGKDIYDNLKAQIGLLKQRKFLVEDLADKRLQQLFETMQDEDYKDVAKYAWWNEEDKTIEIDWDSINEVKDAEEGNLIKEYVKKLEDFQSKYDEQIEQLEEIDDAVQEIKERGKDQYNSLEERVRDALIKQIQDKIDELTEVEEAVNDTNQKLFDSISETLELQRQERDNAKTEEELTDKEKRLAYLQQDSANANALEIAQLQEELADARESYTDTLIDQKISELQRQNEEAAEQRQQQIDLMQRSLDYQEKNGVFWNQVYEYINDGVTAIGDLIPGSDLVKLLQGGEAWTSLSQQGQMEWLKKLEEEVSQAIGYLALSRQLEDIGTKEGTKITFTNAYDQKLTGTVDKNGNVVVTNADGSTTTYKDVYQSYDGTYHTMETVGEARAAVKPATSSKPGATKTPPTSTTTYKVTVGDDGKATVEEVDGYGGDYVSDKTAQEAADEMNSWKMEKVPEKSKDGQITLVAQPVKVNPGEGRVSTFIDQRVKQHNGASTTKFATGGLADFTGPAWLDGSKTHPELVLNARDTQNFIELKDVLADMRKSGGLSMSGGDNYYDIDVNVDQMSSDYDVDRAIDRIKTRLAQDGAYRNVNTLSRLR